MNITSAPDRETVFQAPATVELSVTAESEAQALALITRSDRLPSVLLGNWLDQHAIVSVHFIADASIVSLLDSGDGYRITGTMILHIRTGSAAEALSWASIYGDEITKRVAEMTLQNKMEITAYNVHSDEIEAVQLMDMIEKELY